MSSVFKNKLTIHIIRKDKIINTSENEMSSPPKTFEMDIYYVILVFRRAKSPLLVLFQCVFINHKQPIKHVFSFFSMSL